MGQGVDCSEFPRISDSWWTEPLLLLLLLHHGKSAAAMSTVATSDYFRACSVQSTEPTSIQYSTYEHAILSIGAPSTFNALHIRTSIVAESIRVVQAASLMPVHTCLDLNHIRSSNRKKGNTEPSSPIDSVLGAGEPDSRVTTLLFLLMPGSHRAGI
jgi:hypothetical protein